MRMNFRVVTPNSGVLYYPKGHSSNVTVINRTSKEISADGIIEPVLDDALAVNGYYRHLAKDVSEYVDGRCSEACIYLFLKALDRGESTEMAILFQGTDIPGSRFDYKDPTRPRLRGLHFVLGFEHNDLFLTVDVTIAQLKDFRFINTAAMLLVTTPDPKDVINGLEYVYKGGSWLIEGHLQEDSSNLYNILSISKAPPEVKRAAMLKVLAL